jgi:hypothetical protein
MRTSRWKEGTTLVEVIKAIVNHLDEPDPDYAVNFGKDFVYQYSSRYGWVVKLFDAYPQGTVFEPRHCQT